MSYENELKVVLEAIQEAAELLRTEFHRSGGPRGQSGHADSDEEAEWLIRKRLHSAFPNYRYRGEETGSISTDDSHVWLVDPNDGTSAYLRGARGSAVSIGLIREGIPVLGAVYAFVAPDDRGDLIYWAEGSEIIRNGVSLKTSWDSLPNEKKILLVSLHRESVISEVLTCIKPYRYIAYPSIAYRMALVAAGEGSVAVSWHNPGDWDYAAGHALIRGAGGIFVSENGNEISYSPNGESKTRRCFGGDPEVVRDLLSRDWNRIQIAYKNSENVTDSLFQFSRPKAGQAIMDPLVLARAQGCLFGQCAGDALGQQVEFLQADDIRRKYPHGISTMENGGTWNLLAGQITDDSELALLLARSIVAEGKYNSEKVARAYHYWFSETKPFDIGGTITRALQAAKYENTKSNSVASTRSAAADRDSQANGSLMRIGPLAIYGHDMESKMLWRLACDESRLTHPNLICQQACALFVCAIAYAIRSGNNPIDIYEYVLEVAAQQDIDSTVMVSLQSAKTTLPKMNVNSGWVLNAFQNAFYQLLHTQSAEEAIGETVMLGGDTDTNAAIVGALLGAAHGRDSIPFSWRQMLLSCKPHAITGAHHPRPLCLWPSDLPILSEQLIVCGRSFTARQ